MAANAFPTRLLIQWRRLASLLPRVRTAGRRNLLRGPVAAIAITTALIGVLAWFSFREQSERLRDDAALHLEATAELKAAHVEAWYLGQVAGLQEAAASPFFNDAIREWVAGPRAELDDKISLRLEVLRRSRDFLGVSIYDPTGRPLKTVGRVPEPTEEVRSAIGQAVARKRLVATSFRIQPGTARLSLELAIPIFEDNHLGARTEAVLVAQADAGKLLTGLGPRPGSLGADETILVTRTASGYLYLTTRLGPDGAPLTPVIAASETSLAGLRVVNGQRGAFEAMSYRGVPVLAAGQAVAGTPWHVVTKQDAAVIRGKTARLMIEIGTLALLGFGVVAAIVAMWWRAERSRVDAELRRASERAEEMEARLGWVSRFANDVILLLDESGRILDANERVHDLYGYTREELRGMKIAQLREQSPASLAEFHRQFARMLHDGSMRFETRHVHKDGSPFPVEVSSRAVEHGGRTYVQSIVRDITERVRDQRELTAGEARYRSLFDANPHPMWAFDVETLRFLAVNDAAVARYGYSKSEFLEMTIADIRPPDDVPLLTRHLADLQKADLRESGLWRHRTKDGRLIDVEITSHAMTLDGRAARIVLAHDVTELLRMQAALAESNALLERKVAERTRDLNESKDRAEAADRAKTAFLRSVSHELRSPLHSIVGFNSILLEGIDGELNAVQRDHLQIIRDASQQLLDIINDLLDVSKIEAGLLVIDAHPYRLDDVLDRVMHAYRPQADEKKLSFRREGHLDDVPTIGDERRIEQIVGKLVSNAIKFTTEGDVVVRCGLRNGQVFVDVEDTGPGISAGDLSKLFRHFSQIEPGEGRLTEGTGLGLSIAHRLAVAMGGRLTVRSTPGRGSTFSLALPITTPEVTFS